MTDGYKVKKIFLGEDLVWPKENWALLDETDFKHSSNSKNNMFKFTWWGDNTSFTNTAYDTTNWRIYSTSWHSMWKIYLKSDAFTPMQIAKKLKVIYDYLYLSNNTNYYTASLWIFWQNLDKNSSWYTTNWSLTYNPGCPSIINIATPYSGVLEYDLINDTWTFAVTNLNNQSTGTSTVTWLKQYWKVTSNSSFFTTSAGDWYTYAVWGVYLDQGTTCYFGDVHVYYML